MHSDGYGEVAIAEEDMDMFKALKTRALELCHARASFKLYDCVHELIFLG